MRHYFTMVPHLKEKMDKMKRIMEEMKENMRRVNPIEDLVYRTDSPFMASINGHLLPPKFKMPSLDSYDGTHDPFDHIATFKTTMHFQGAKGVWPDELPGVLWAYRTIVRTPTGETPFKLAYGSEAVIPAEVHMANHRVMVYQEKDNTEQLRLNLDLVDEVRMDAEHRTAKYKNLMARRYDAMVKPRRFNIGDLVLKKVSLATKDPSHGKLGPNWEGPYRIINYKRQGSYYLEALDGRKLEHPWNVEHLRRYYQ